MYEIDSKETKTAAGAGWRPARGRLIATMSAGGTRGVSAHVSAQGLMRRKQVAQYFNITVSTLDHWRHHPDFPAPIRTPGGVRWRPEDIRDWKGVTR